MRAANKPRSSLLSLPLIKEVADGKPQAQARAVDEFGEQLPDPNKKAPGGSASSCLGARVGGLIRI